MSSWAVLGEGWTPEIRARCADICAEETGDPPCYSLAGQGLIGGEIVLITPCDDCKSNAKDTPNG